MQNCQPETPLNQPAAHELPRVAETRTAQEQAARQRRQQHAARCRQAPPMSPAEAQHLVAEFLARRTVTNCPPRFATAVIGR